MKFFHQITIAFSLSMMLSAERIEISSLSELASLAEKNGNTVVMKSGVYHLTDLIPLSSIEERRKAKHFSFLNFSGNDNTFELKGVIIEVDTALRAALKPPIHSNEFVISGTNNEIIGLGIRCTGEGTSPGGALVAITGDGNTIREGTFLVRGSKPYGYGDLFGKGGPDVLPHQKHSGVLITGSNTRVEDCKLVMRSFGHGFYLQRQASHIRFKNCHVEGEMRTTDDMLKERSGPAHGVKFRTIAKNREGKSVVTPGYIKSLAEDGFRTYSQNKNVSFINCTAKNMRGGFELRTREGVMLENCSVIGCERGYWISSDAILTGCKGDAKYGPLLFAEGDNAKVEIELLPDHSDRQVHALATIHGKGNQITIKPADGKLREVPLPIKVGYGTPGAGEGMSPIPERPCEGLKLNNTTGMPVIIGENARDCEITSNGKIIRNNGRNILIQKP